MGYNVLFRAFTLFFPLLLWAAQPFHLQTITTKLQPLSERNLNLENRYANAYINDVFKNNILLTLAYTTNKVQNKSDINWEEINNTYYYEIVLNPGEVFAFHDDILAVYQNRPLKTTNAHFSASEGFLSSGNLYGDGVCHLASLIKWTASDAGLFTFAPVNHDFANIPDIPKEYGVSIYSSPDQKGVNHMQNLYILNTFDHSVKFTFEYKNNNLNLSISKA
jgi:hypothetical protein